MKKHAIFLILFILCNAAFSQTCENIRDEYDRSYCFSKKYLKIDEDLNSNYGELSGLLTKQQNKTLNEIQLKWMKQRNSECGMTSNNKFYIDMKCATETTNTQNEFLKAQLSSCKLGACSIGSDKEKFVHAIGVYEGSYPGGGSPHSGGYHPDGNIDVVVKNNPNASSVVLILMSYEPVIWNIIVQKGVKIEKIILSNYENTSKIVGVENVPVLRENLGYSYDAEAILKLNEKIKPFTDASIKTAQGGYHGKLFEVY